VDCVVNMRGKQIALFERPELYAIETPVGRLDTGHWAEVRAVAHVYGTLAVASSLEITVSSVL
jgi:hypothetical protein